MSEQDSQTLRFFPTCPYCGYQEKDAWEIHKYNPNWHEGEQLEIECSRCEQPYLVVYDTMYSSEAREETNG